MGSTTDVKVPVDNVSEELDSPAAGDSADTHNVELHETSDTSGEA